MFETVVEQLVKSGSAKGARIIVEKPFGHDLASAQELNRILLSAFDESAIFRIDHYLAKDAVYNMVTFRFSNAFMEPMWNRNYIESVQLIMAEDFGIQGRGSFYDQTGTIRDVIQNHVFQVMCNLAMEPPARDDAESLRDEKVKVLKSIPPITSKNLVRGQFNGYLQEKGVAPNSKMETFAAMKVEINSWRWQGVPFYIMAGKNLPASCLELVARLRRPPQTCMNEVDGPQNYIRFQLSPEITAAIGVSVTTAGGGKRHTAELLASRHPRPEDMEAYERVLSEAMIGDATFFARQDYVEEAWRIVDPVLKEQTPVYVYEPHTWGPKEVDENVLPPGGWDRPKPDIVPTFS
jgi:glucose-6-phosphate 1-dehydrogenase